MKRERQRLRYDLASQYEVDIQDVEYRRVGGASLGATVYRPKGDGPFPMLLDFHGGGWRRYDRSRDRPIDAELASHGLVVASLDFRLADVAPYCGMMQDVNFGIRWFKAHAAEFGASPAFVGALGFATGGHLVLMSGIRPTYPAWTVDHVGDFDASLSYVIVAGCVGYDMVRLYASRLKGTYDYAWIDTYMGGIEGIVDASPQHVVASDEVIATPPMLLLSAGADGRQGRLPSDAAKFALSYADRGGFVELGIFPGAPHIFLNPGLVKESEAMFRGLAAIRGYIARQLDYCVNPFEAS